MDKFTVLVVELLFFVGALLLGIAGGMTINKVSIEQECNDFIKETYYNGTYNLFYNGGFKPAFPELVINGT